MKIYIYGCSCGINGVYARRAKAYAHDNGMEVLVINSKYDDASRMEHASLLQQSGLDGDQYTPIVEENGTITKLREWNK